MRGEDVWKSGVAILGLLVYIHAGMCEQKRLESFVVLFLGAVCMIIIKMVTVGGYRLSKKAFKRSPLGIVASNLSAKRILEIVGGLPRKI